SLHSGTDYPARSLSAYRQFLADNRSRGFVSFFDGANEQYGFRSRYQLYYPFPYFVRHARARRIAMYMQQWLGIRRVPLAGLSPAFGWHWWTLPVPIATWVAEESLSPRIARFYRTTAIPEEMLFQTLLANSHHRGNIERNNLRFVKASASGHIPKWLDINDLSDICNLGAFFCRKVVAGRDLGLCEALERQPA
ncbi:MAG TPA: beta-1,6-N-acetylglucosaminyltransferase, partial [Gammaproteobacteria bacterium]|nr:beta-1,6-N-acetylglucosaminyltransferase [Gammaproteobacteria bacterium]